MEELQNLWKLCILWNYKYYYKKKITNSVILSKGQNNFNHGELNFNISNNKINQIFHFSNKSSDGYIKGTDYKQLFLSSKI